MKNFFIFGAVLSAFAVNASAACKYEVVRETTKIGWTAFKTMKKVAVKGEMPGFSLKPSKKGAKYDSISGLMNKVEAEIDSTKVSTGNPTRDETLAKHFFAQMKGLIIKAEFEDAKASATDPNSGTAMLEIKMNGQRQKVPATWKYVSSDGLEAHAVIDVLKFHGDKAMAELNKACVDLHKGEDGVSKTWSEVEVHLWAKLKEHCE